MWILIAVMLYLRCNQTQGITNILYGKIKTSSSKNRYFSKTQENFPKNLPCYPQFGTIYVYISVHILTDTANARAGAGLSFLFFLNNWGKDVSIWVPMI